MKKKFLILDDQIEVSEVIKELIFSSLPDTEVVIFQNIEEARRIRENDLFTHAFIDLNLEEESGLDFLIFLKRQRIKLETVVISAFPTLVEETFSTILGVSKFFPKPLDTDKIKTYLSCLENKNNISEYYSVNPLFLKSYKVFPVDIFVKINESKMLKIFPKHQIIDSVKLEKFYKEKRQLIWVKSEDYLNLVEMQYVPVRKTLLKENYILPFNLYIRNNLNYEPVFEKDDLFSTEKKKELQKIKVFYINDEDESLFENYLSTILSNDLSKSNLPFKYRVNILNTHSKKCLLKAYNNSDYSSIVTVKNNFIRLLGRPEISAFKYLEEMKENQGFFQQILNITTISIGIIDDLKEKVDSGANLSKEVKLTCKDNKTFLENKATLVISAMLSKLDSEKLKEDECIQFIENFNSGVLDVLKEQLTMSKKVDKNLEYKILNQILFLAILFILNMSDKNLSNEKSIYLISEMDLGFDKSVLASFRKVVTDKENLIS